MKEDITYCDGTNCKVKSDCARYTDKVSQIYYSSFVEAPTIDGTKCLYFMSNKPACSMHAQQQDEDEENET